MEKKIIYAVAVGGIGYLIYKNFDKIKSLFKGGIVTTETTTEESGSATGNTTSNTTTQADPYKLKVEALQALLKVGIDGKAGKQTNGALENLYSPTPMTFPAETAFQANYPLLRKNGKGVVTPSNVEFYISALKNKTTPTQLFYKNSGNFVQEMRNQLPKYQAFPTFGK